MRDRMNRILVPVFALAFSLPALASETHWNRLYTASAEASSFLENSWNKYQENYHPNYAFDDNPETAWVEGVDGYGEGEKLTWHVSEVSSARKIRLRIRNGYQKSEKLFLANSAPKEIELSVLSRSGKPVTTAKLTLEKKMGWQEITLPFRRVKRSRRSSSKS